MADAKLTALTADTAPSSDDLVYLVDDVAGTPTSKKVTVANLLGVNVAISEVSVTGGVTLTSSAYGKQHVCSGTSADYTVVLPTASGHAGEIITLRMSNALTKLVTLDGNSSETIDGQTTRIMWAGESSTLMSDGTNFVKLAGKTRPMVAQMHLSTTQTGIASGSVTKINLDTSDIDNTGRMVNTGSSRLDILRPGVYLVAGLARAAINGTATSFSTIPRNNGTGVVQSIIPIANAAVTAGGYCASPVVCAAGDNLDLAMYQGSTANASAYGGTLTDGACQLTATEQPSW